MLTVESIVDAFVINMIHNVAVGFIINPRRACAARVTVVVLYVCVSDCPSAHTILAVREIKSIMKDTILLCRQY